MKDLIFREYDIRGKIGSELMIEEAYPLGHALVHYLLQKKPSLKTVVIGMDGRTHSSALMKELCRACNDAGLDVIFIGVCPSPVLYFALHTLSVDAGLMITASHNGPEYNGIKICCGTRSVWGAEIKEIAKLYRQHVRVQSDHTGTTSEYTIIPDYVAWLASHFQVLKNMQYSIVIDCGNGTAGTVLPLLIKTMEWEKVSLLYPEVDGAYPHHPADPTIFENMKDVKKILTDSSVAMGIGLDGDCDRMAAMTKDGHLIMGDVLLSIFAVSMAAENPGMRVVYDVKSSRGLTETLQNSGLVPVISACGHSIIKETMKDQKALLAGELSCHFFFLDRHFGYDDAIYAMMRLFEIILKTNKALEELVAYFPIKYTSKEFRIPYNPDDKNRIIATIKRAFQNREEAQLITIDGVRAELPYGWGILRTSNTQPVLSIRFESDTKEGLRQIHDDFYEILKTFFEGDFLNTHLEIEQ